ESLTIKNTLKHHPTEVSIIKVSHNGKLVASGDSKKNIYIWSAETGELLIDRFVYHTSKVFDIAWSKDDNLLISGSLDRCVILWSIPEKSKLKIIPDMDSEVVYSVLFLNE